MTGTMERMTVDEMVREYVKAHLAGDGAHMAELDVAGRDFTNHGYYTKKHALSRLSDDELRMWLEKQERENEKRTRSRVDDSHGS